MQRFLTAAAVVSTIALASTGLALAQTSPSSSMPSSGSHSVTTPGMTPSSGMTNPSTGAARTPSMTGQSSANNASGINAQSPAMIKQAQGQLRQKGLYNGPIDGQMGPETASALSRFQQDNGLPQSAQLDQATMSKLIGGTANAGSGSSTPPATMNPSMTPSSGGSSATNPSAGTSGSTTGLGHTGTGATTR